MLIPTKIVWKQQFNLDLLESALRDYKTNHKFDLETDLTISDFDYELDSNVTLEDIENVIKRVMEM